LLDVDALVVHLCVVESVVPVLALGAVEPTFFAIVILEELRPVLAWNPVPLGDVGQLAAVRRHVLGHIVADFLLLLEAGAGAAH